MNDRQDPYGTGGPSPEGAEPYGYDEYGRPLYRQPAPPPPAPHDPYAVPYPAAGGGPERAEPDPWNQQGAGYPAYPSGPGYDQGGYAGPGGYAGEYPGPEGYPGGPEGYAGAGYQTPAQPAPGVPPQHQRRTAEPAGTTPDGRPYDPYDPYAAGPYTSTEVGPYAAPGGPGYPGSGDEVHAAPGGDGYPGPGPDPAGQPVAEPAAPAARPAPSERGETTGPDTGEYQTEQFSFVEDTEDSSEDVIDWLKFSESRTERRDERKRRGRNRLIALTTVLALALAGGVGYLWFTDRLPGLSQGGGSEPAAGAEERREVIAVHLHEVDSPQTATVLLVDDASAGRATTVLLPNELAVSVQDGQTTTLGQAVDAEGSSSTREALGALLGTEITGTWRLDTPFLENLVELVGGITLNADTTVPGAKKGAEPLVRAGKDRELDGRAAVGYATHLESGEPQARQLQRFGQVIQAVLWKMSPDPSSATEVVGRLGQIPDPSLTDGQLGASLAHLAQLAQDGAHRTSLLPVEPDGTLSEKTSEELVKEVLGGTVSNTDPDAAVRVSLKNASGESGTSEEARVLLVNGGYTVVRAVESDTPQAQTTVTYGDAQQKARAREVASTLGLPASAVSADPGAGKTHVTVVLGQDFPG